MIIKIGARGSDPGGLIRYLADTQTHYRGRGNNVHTNPRLITGSVGYTGPLDKETVTQVVADLRTPLYLWQDQITDKSVIWNAAVVVHPSEGPLSDEMWKNISRDFVHEMGVAEKGPSRTRWVAINHGLSNGGADHVHVTVNLVCEDGRRIDPWMEYRTASKVAMSLEDKYGLMVVPGRRTGMSSRTFTKNDHAVSIEQGRPETRRTELERRVRAASVGVIDSDAFMQNLAADGIRVRFREDTAGNRIGYSVNLPETTTKNGTEHWWSGGKLARDLSLPRLETFWKNNTPGKSTHMRAVDELVALQKALPNATTEQLAVESHRIAGALAVVSAKVEPEPGPIAQAASEAGKLAQTRTYSQAIKPPALSVALLFSMAVDPDGPVGKAIMIRQLMATYQALLDAHRARRAVVTPERTAPSMAAGAEDEVMEMALTAGVTAGAVVLERAARTREAAAERKPIPGQWDASSIRQMRDQAKWDEMRDRAAARELAPQITQEQQEKIAELAAQYGAPGMTVGTELFTAKEADEYIRHLGSQVYSGPTAGEHVTLPQSHAQELRQVDDFMDDLEAKHGHKDLSGPGAGEGAARWENRVATAVPWAQDPTPATEAQLDALRARGMNPDGLGLSKATVDSMLSLTPAAKNASKPVAPPGKNQRR